MKIVSAEFATSAAGPKQYPSDRKPHIAFAGRSNVGKSSLINAVVNRRNLVKTSATPGKTQLINFFVINSRFYLVDLPGYGYARAPREVVEAWGPLIEGYLKGTPELRAVVVLFDSRREPDERDRRLLEWLRHYGIPAIPVLTKADKLTRQESARQQRAISGKLDFVHPPLLTSVKSGQGIAELRAEIGKAIMNRRNGETENRGDR